MKNILKIFSIYCLGCVFLGGCAGNELKEEAQISNFSVSVSKKMEVSSDGKILSLEKDELSHETEKQVASNSEHIEKAVNKKVAELKCESGKYIGYIKIENDEIKIFEIAKFDENGGKFKSSGKTAKLSGEIHNEDSSVKIFKAKVEFYDKNLPNATIESRTEQFFWYWYDSFYALNPCKGAGYDKEDNISRVIYHSFFYLNLAKNL